MADLIAAEDMKVEGIYLETGTTEPRAAFTAAAM